MHTDLLCETVQFSTSLHNSLLKQKSNPLKSIIFLINIQKAVIAPFRQISFHSRYASHWDVCLQVMAREWTWDLVQYSNRLMGTVQHSERETYGETQRDTEMERHRERHNGAGECPECFSYIGYLLPKLFLCYTWVFIIHRLDPSHLFPYDNQSFFFFYEVCN